MLSLTEADFLDKTETKKIEILLADTEIDIRYKKYTIMLNFTTLFDGKAKSNKTYQEIVFHTPNDAMMVEFITGLNQLLVDSGLSMNKIKNIEFKHKSPQPNWADELEYRDSVDFNVVDMAMENAEVILKLEETTNERRKKFIDELVKRFKVKITPTTNCVWFPSRPLELSPHKNKMWITEAEVKNKYPIYIISIGRWEKRSTQRYLEWSGLDYKVVVEPREYDEYAKVIPADKLLVTPENYSQTLKNGSTPVRNFVWQHSISIGAKRHWILDDNMISYKRCHQGERTLVKGGVAFRAVEDFCDRFTNIKMAGHNYTMFGIASNTKLKPIVYNSRCYSSILLDNSLLTDGLLPEGWRGKWNEDTDLSLRVMEAGFPTALFNTFLAEKVRTMAQKGGNTDTLYNLPDCHLLKAQFLADAFPKYAKVTYRFSRIHHYVDYSSFKHLRPQYKEDYKIENKPNNYGMILTEKDVSWNPYAKVSKKALTEI